MKIYMIQALKEYCHFFHNLIIVTQLADYVSFLKTKYFGLLRINEKMFGKNSP